jgi:hypothetical protein
VGRGDEPPHTPLGYLFPHSPSEKKGISIFKVSFVEISLLILQNS